MSDDNWNPPLTTERLLLSPLTPADANDLVELLSDERLYGFTGGGPPELEELRSRFEQWASRVSPDGRERWLNWIVRERQSGLALGTLQATVRTDEPGPVAEVAWVVGVRAQGYGYATEAARALIEFLLSMGVREVIAHIHPDHDASARVATAVAMQPTQEWTEGERVWRLSDASIDRKES